MTIKTLLLTAAAVAMLSATGALADDWDHGRDRHDHATAERHDRDDWRGHENWHWRDDRGAWHGDHDRYWREGYRGYRGGDIYFRTLRSHGYSRWDGAPYWYQGRYVVRSYDHFGRPVFVELNPYTGGFVGVVRF